MWRRNVLRRTGRAAVAAGAGGTVVKGVDQKSVSDHCGEEENSYWVRTYVLVVLKICSCGTEDMLLWYGTYVVVVRNIGS